LVNDRSHAAEGPLKQIRLTRLATLPTPIADPTFEAIAYYLLFRPELGVD
jgi:hypothetical protein